MGGEDAEPHIAAHEGRGRELLEEERVGAESLISEVGVEDLSPGPRVLLADRDKDLPGASVITNQLLTDLYLEHLSLYHSLWVLTSSILNHQSRFKIIKINYYKEL